MGSSHPNTLNGLMGKTLSFCNKGEIVFWCFELISETKASSCSTPEMYFIYGITSFSSQYNRNFIVFLGLNPRGLVVDVRFVIVNVRFCGGFSLKIFNFLCVFLYECCPFLFLLRHRCFSK